MTKGILFDWDGTLVDTLPLLFKAHNHVRGVLGHPLWGMDEYRTHMHFSAKELYPQLYGERSDEAQKIVYDYVEAEHLVMLEVKPNAPELLENIKHLPCGIVSNKRPYIIKRELEHLGWQGYFKTVLGSGDAVRDKPKGDPILLGAQNLKLSKDDICYVGDSATDAQAAHDAGVHCYLVHYEATTLDNIQNKGWPVTTINNLSELPNVL